MSKHPLLEAIANKPLLIARGQEDFFRASLQFLTEHEKADDLLAVHAFGGDDDFWDEDMDWARPYTVVDGILQVPVMGVLLNRFPYQFGRWATGYDYIERAVMRGMEDPMVRGIALVIDSPGGEVAGCFELVDKLYDWRAEKPLWAFAADHAYSAAFAIASAAGRVAVTRSGGTGSVGVVTAHVDFSGYLDNAGIKVTFIFAGQHKVDGNPYEALPKDVRDRIQARIDKIYGVFTETVARNRDMEQDAVRETEALTYDAEDSIAVGFADVVGALEDEMLAFHDYLENPEGEYMALKPTQTPAADAAEGIDQATHDAAVSSARAEGVTEGQATGAKAERDRINAILGSEEGKARPKAALSAALKTDMTAEQATAFLSDLPEEKAEAPKTETQTQTPAPKGQTPFDKAMGKSNPDVGSDDDEGEGGDQPEAAAATILGDYRRARGIAPKKTA
jgi:signal peptide peptidase SppA